MDHISFQIFKNRKADLFSDRDLMVVFNLSDEIDIRINEKKSKLKQNDIVVVNEQSRLSCDETSENSLFVVFVLDGDELRNCFQKKKYLFFCDSSEEFNSDHEVLKRYLTDILVSSFESDEYHYLKLNRLFYDLVFFLINHFSSEVFYDKSDVREELIAYVDRHYGDDLSLKRVSADFGMNDQYFGKYFKKHVGKAYYTYVVETRMIHARKQIESGNKKISQIAMDCGFANISSFNSFFKRIYHQAPVEYRDSLEKAAKREAEDSYQAVIESLQRGGHKTTQDDSFEVDALNRKEYFPFWSDMVNFGDPVFLDNAEINEQMKMLKRELDHTYLRIDLNDAAYTYEKDRSFSKEAIRLDKTYLMGYVPWLVIDYRKVSDSDILADYLKSLLSFFANRHSIHQIQKWRIEIAYNSVFDNEKCSSLFRLFRKIEKVIQHFNMQNALMGFAVSLGNREGLKKLYEYMDINHIHVEAQTFTKDPFIYFEKEDGAIGERRDKYDLFDELMNLKMIASHYHQDIKKTYIVSSFDSVSTFNVIGDSCWKGAELMKEFIRCFDMLSGYSFQNTFDIMEKEAATEKILFGGGGVLSCDGIKKPVYHCLAMFARVGNYFVGSNDNAAVFSNDDGNFSILCHNAKTLGHRYYLNEGQIRARDIDSCFDDLSPLSLHLKIGHIDDGKYIIKTREVSKEGGSVQENYVKMTNDEKVYIHPNDVEFLRQTSIPMISVYETTVKDQVLELNITLSANSFSLINVVKQF